MLSDLLNPEGWFADDAPRKSILFDAWQLVLLVHPVLKQRVGDPQLAAPGRRIEAIGAVERQLAIQPNEATLLEFRRSLFENLQEREYFEAAKTGVPADFSHRYAEELGMTLVANPDQWQRGAQFLRIAANGQPLRRPSIFKRLADAYAQAGETLQATRYLQFVRDCGLEIDVQNFPDDQRAIYFATVKRLGDEAAARVRRRCHLQLQPGDARSDQRRANLACPGRAIRKEARHLQCVAHHREGACVTTAAIPIF